MLTLTEYSENFEAWCADCVMIHDKLTGQSVPFRLNAPQRRVAAIMETQRRAGKPIRIIMLKARQWGGSTLTQIYMAWMQIVRHKGWHSLICSHVKDASANIRGMYSHLLRNYPEELRGSVIDPKKWVFAPFERSSNVCHIPARDCRVAVTSAYAPDAVRGSSFQMAHLSEVAFWADGDSEAAERIVRTVGGSVPMEKETVVVMESTADGTDNYFHREWQRAVKGESDKTPVFVPWHEIEIYTMTLTEDERKAWPARFDDYELALLHKTGLPVEKVAWYHCKRREYATHEQMMAEYPSTPAEAFAHAGTPWLTPAESLRLGAVGELPPEADTEESALILLVPRQRGGESHIAVARRYISGDVAVCSTQTVADDTTEAIDALESMAKSLGAHCCVVRFADSDISARWLDRVLDSRKLRCLPPLQGSETADEEAQSLTLTPQTLAELHDGWHELLMQGSWIEADETSLKKLKETKASKGYSTPEVILRLAAAGALSSPTSPQLKPEDFF